MATEDFPGLNKRHGFFKVIERNQVDRDEYHQKVEETKEIQQQDVRKKKKKQKRPTREVYRPPPSRGERSSHVRSTDSTDSTDSSTPEGYRIQIELERDKWHDQVVTKIGNAEEISMKIASEYGLDETKREAITELMVKFEDKLKIQ